MKKLIFALLFFGFTSLFASQNDPATLFSVQGKFLSPSKFSTYDQEKRFIWTCFQAPSTFKVAMKSNLILQNDPLCLCQPGGEVNGVGLHVSHVKGIDLEKSEHLAYREIFLETQKCQSFAAYSL